MTQRTFVAAGMAVPAASQDAGEPDLAALIGEADLICDKPAPRSEEGMPIGNGRMGTLVWTAPESFRMQINRVDVYGNGSATNSVFERQNGGGCGFGDIDFGREVVPARRSFIATTPTSKRAGGRKLSGARLGSQPRRASGSWCETYD